MRSRSGYKSSGVYAPRSTRGPVDATPRQMQAKYPGRCGCGVAITVGDDILYYPAQKKVECMDCAAETLAHLADERGGM